MNDSYEARSPLWRRLAHLYLRRVGLTCHQERILPGGVDDDTYRECRTGVARTLADDQMERLSLVLGIYKGHRLLFADDTGGIRWLKAPNTDFEFDGSSPLDRMLRGGVGDLYGVRRYLNGWRFSG